MILGHRYQHLHHHSNETMFLPVLQHLPSLTTPHSIPRIYLISLRYLGALSRFTHGRFTPTFYAYQIQHAPDDDLTRYIPVIDTTLDTLLLLGGSWARTGASTAVCAFPVYRGCAAIGERKRGEIRVVELGDGALGGLGGVGVMVIRRELEMGMVKVVEGVGGGVYGEGFQRRCMRCMSAGRISDAGLRSLQRRQ
ncbi:hypothetical protein GE09DRAFT_14946 [Coniochaeta sp. 2T2.1]|nr:hypothetical protein GE09DRAFT_14946 [Coniochaeta sp. 2T2.1]